MSYDPETFTTQANKSVAKSVEFARERKNIEVAPLHLAYVLFQYPASLGYQLAEKCGVKSERLLSSLEDGLRRYSKQDPPPNEIYPNAAFMRVLKKAKDLSTSRKDTHTSVDSLILALLDNEDTKNCLEKIGLTRKQIEDAVKSMRGS